MLNILDFFRGKILASYDSNFHGKVEVISYLGETKVVAGGLLQSGSVIKQLWQKPLASISHKDWQKEDEKPLKILLLGLGGGTLLPLLTQQYPNCQITALEIDPVMIQIAKKYFSVEKKKDLDIIGTDAFAWVGKYTGEKFDFVLVDLFCGEDWPPQTRDLSFWKDLQKIISQNSTIICNCLFYKDNQLKTQNFIEMIEPIFPNIQLVRNMSNLFVVIEN